MTKVFKSIKYASISNFFQYLIVDVLLKNVGDAPILTQKKWAVPRTKTVSELTEFLRRLLRSEQSQTLFLYVQQSFAPAPDVEIGSLHDCFGANGKLVFQYCLTPAWG